MTTRKPRKSIGPKDDETGPGGRERLVHAALRLAAKTRSLHSLGVRELGREAGLNANTFYRHFEDIDDLAMAVIEQFSQSLRAPLRELRRSISGADENARRTVELVFDFARANPEAFLVGVREMYGASKKVREALRAMIAEAADDMSEDLLAMRMLPGIDEKLLREIAEVVVVQTFHAALDYLEHPSRRADIIRRLVQMIELLFAGAAVQSSRRSAR